MSQETPRIYVACLAAYNAGYLHGIWIEATDELESIQAQVQRMLSTSPEPDAEEYAIHDYDNFGSYPLHEYEGLETANQIAVFLEDYPEPHSELLNHFGGDINDAQHALEETYYGEYKSLADYAQGLTEETTEIPENLAFYIDYEAMARDMELNSDVFTIKTGFEEVHVFWGH